MPESKNAIEKMERQVPRKAAQAVKVAFKQALKSGQEVLIVSDATLYRVSPDGRRTAIRSVAARFPVIKGAKLRIQ